MWEPVKRSVQADSEPGPLRVLISAFDPGEAEAKLHADSCMWHRNRFVRTLFLTWSLACLDNMNVHANPIALDLKVRRLMKADPSSDRWQPNEQSVQWEPKGTAAIICDMWNQHWCKGATERVAEMAPRMNEMIARLRDKGVLIIHCPSDTMKFYEGSPGRKLAQAAPKVSAKVPLKGWCSLDSTKEPALPIDDSDGGCDDQPRCKEGSPWKRQIESIEIKPGDAVTDSSEAYNLMVQRGITNVLVMGVHQNMCVLGRPFSIRQMVYQGQNVLLVRDLTDSMYNSRSKPFVNHFIGNDLVTWHIEKYWCGTITSDRVLGGGPFRFKGDTAPPREFNN